jgi:hypothetical protein
MKRVIFDIILLISVFILPWWISTVLVLVGIFMFREFYEFLAIGMIMHILYAVPGPRIIASDIWFPIILVGVYIGIQALKRYIILYKNEI